MLLFVLSLKWSFLKTKPVYEPQKKVGRVSFRQKKQKGAPYVITPPLDFLVERVHPLWNTWLQGSRLSLFSMEYLCHASRPLVKLCKKNRLEIAIRDRSNTSEMINFPGLSALLHIKEAAIAYQQQKGVLHTNSVWLMVTPWPFTQQKTGGTKPKPGSGHSGAQVAVW